MTKRNAEEACMSPPNGFRAKAACFHHTIPTWFAQDETMMTSPPPVRRQSLFDETSIPTEGFNAQIDMEMGSPMHQTSPMQRQFSAQKFWKAMQSPAGNRRVSLSKRASSSLEMAHQEPPHPLCQPKFVPKEQLDAVLSEVSSLKQTIAWLTRELNDSRSRIAQLESSSQDQAGFRQSSTPLATGFQHQPVYCPPDQYISTLQG